MSLSRLVKYFESFQEMWNFSVPMCDTIHVCLGSFSVLFCFCKDLFVDVSIMCVFGCFEHKLFQKLMFSTILWGLVRQDFLCKALAEVPRVPSSGLDVLNFTCLFSDSRLIRKHWQKQYRYLSCMIWSHQQVWMLYFSRTSKS